MWQKALLALLLSTAKSAAKAFQAYAATTPDPLDDAIAAAVIGLLNDFQGAGDKAAALAALDSAKAHFEQLP